jgi:hypothetical protein
VHTDGDGTTGGWFRNDSPPGDGGFVTTEPVGTEAWMPLNDHPTAKPSYDFYDTVTAGRTAIGNGMLISTVANPPDAHFPGGSTTWHWQSAGPGRELPGREQRWGVRLDLARRERRDPVLRGPE